MEIKEGFPEEVKLGRSQENDWESVNQGNRGKVVLAQETACAEGLWQERTGPFQRNESASLCHL